MLAEDGTILEGGWGWMRPWGRETCRPNRVSHRRTPADFGHPEEFLAELGVEAGTQHSGVTYARNGCPSKGTVDIFIEPSLPLPELVVMGASPVAKALCSLAAQFQFAIRAVERCGFVAHIASTLCGDRNAGAGDMIALNAALAVAHPRSVLWEVRANLQPLVKN